MIDPIDSKILNELQQNSRATVREIAARSSIPITTVHNRLRKLKAEGVIRRFTIEFDYEKVGRAVSTFVFVNISHKSLARKQEGIDSLKKQLRSFPEIEHIYAVTGDIDLILQVRVGSIKELDEFLIKKLRNIATIEKTSTVIILEED